MDLALPMPDTIGRLEKRLTAEIADEAEQWSWHLNALARWEQENLLENPSPALLAEHKATVERLLRFGRFLSLATEHPDFPDQSVAMMVRATQRALQDHLEMRHGPGMARQESERILATFFPMSPELERLLNALWERDRCEPKDREKWNANIERRLRMRAPGCQASAVKNFRRRP